MDDPELRRRIEASLAPNAGADDHDPGETLRARPLDDARPRPAAAARPGATALSGAAPVFEVGDEIARGGMGVVRRARQLGMGREVAIKQLIDPRAVSPGVRRALMIEAVAAGYLDHPNIVPVHEIVRTDDGEVAIAMKLVQGRPWSETLRGARDGLDDDFLERQLEILCALCNAVGFAHSKGILHRDLKPANVMIGEFGEVLLMDWGLAIRWQDVGASSDDLQVVPDRSEANAPAGTPRYMAPEMAEGRGDVLGPWTDVYLLGAILHEILTGRPPHTGRTTVDVLIQASTCPVPEFPRFVPDRLAEICARALSKDPDLRPQNALALRKELRDYLTHRQSEALTDRARGELGPLAGAKVETILAARGPEVVYASFERATSGLQQALLLWPRNRRAARLLAETRHLHARVAEHAGDLALALTQLEGLPGDGVERMRARIRDRIAARDRAEQGARNLRRGLVALAVALAAAMVVGLFALTRAKQRADEDATHLLEKSRDLETALEEVKAERSRADEKAREAEAAALQIQDTLESLHAEKERSDRIAEDANELLNEALENERAALAAAAEARRQLRASERTGASTDGALLGVLDVFAAESEIEALTTRTAEALARRADPTALRALAADLRACLGSRPAADALATLGESDDPLARSSVARAEALDAAYDRLATVELAAVDALSAYLDAMVAGNPWPELDFDARWQETLADLDRDDRFTGWIVEPFADLAPLGRDSDSGLPEFLHLPTHMGPLPVRDDGGRLVRASRCGLVLVLVPGGEPWIGSQATDPDGPGYEPLAAPDEAPVTRVRLDPFLLSKYELTELQWSLMSGEVLTAETVAGPDMPSRAKPWGRTRVVLQARGFTLPTEAQWEHACRAGTSTRWWFGDDIEGMHGFANVLDRSNPAAAVRSGFPWDDGHPRYAPVGRFAPNPFGLYDILGNLSEWVLDPYGPYDREAEPGSGLRRADATPQDAERAGDPDGLGEGVRRVARGGAAMTAAAGVRPGWRKTAPPRAEPAGVGCRPAMRLVRR